VRGLPIWKSDEREKILEREEEIGSEKRKEKREK
jgi:hypothetical protein